MQLQSHACLLARENQPPRPTRNSLSNNQRLQQSTQQHIYLSSSTYYFFVRLEQVIPGELVAREAVCVVWKQTLSE